jgi:hypothetical protein
MLGYHRSAQWSQNNCPPEFADKQLYTMTTRLSRNFQTPVKVTQTAFSTDEKLSIVDQLLKKTLTSKDASGIYGLKPHYYRNLLYKYKTNGTVKSLSGRRCVLSGADMLALDEVLEGKKLSITKEKFVEKVNEMATQTHQSTHTGSKNAQFGFTKPVSRRTVGRIIDKLDAREGNAEVWSDARLKACSDKRNAVAFAVANTIMVPTTHMALCINADGTSVNTGKILGDKEKVVYKGERKQLKTKDSHRKGGGMGFFIKYYMIAGAGGETVEPIFVFQDDNMPAGEIDWYESGALAG